MLHYEMMFIFNLCKDQIINISFHLFWKFYLNKGFPGFKVLFASKFIRYVIRLKRVKIQWETDKNQDLEPKILVAWGIFREHN